MYLHSVCIFKGELELEGTRLVLLTCGNHQPFGLCCCMIVELVSHQSTTSLRLPWRDVSTNCMCFPLLWRDESSVNKALVNLSFDIAQWKIIDEYVG